MGASLLHDVGEFEAGVQNSLESLVFGDALIGYARRLTAGVQVDDETLQLDDIDAVGPGGSYLARPYTRRHHRDVWRSELFDTTTHEQWLGSGSPVLLERLHEAATALLARRQQVLDEAVAARLDSFWRAP
jgi:trimethylamine---corrinoid protein Co-methyltransferase